MAKDKNCVSYWLWLGLLVLTCVPCVGIIFAFAFAFFGENETRKNYFKAHLTIVIAVFLLWIGLQAAGLMAIVLKVVTDSYEHWPQFFKGL